MEKLLLNKTFNTSAMSMNDHRTLNNLLDDLKAITSERIKHGTKEQFSFLSKWLKKPQITKLKNAQLFQKINYERISAAFKDSAEDTSYTKAEQNIFIEVLSLPPKLQKNAFALLCEYNLTKPYNKKEKEQYTALSTTYDKILNQHPKILLSKHDLLASINLGLCLHDKNEELTSQWSSYTPKRKIRVFKEILKEACPDENIDHLQIKATDLHFSSYFQNKHIDTMICSENKLNCYTSWLLTTTHELQHRRQTSLINELTNKRLDKNSPAYYQANIFQENLIGGYISSEAATNIFDAATSLTMYQTQPVEKDANTHAKLTNLIRSSEKDIPKILKVIRI